jgi:hypothetical protein
MTRKRDGPAPLTATPGPGVRRTRASLAPFPSPAQAALAGARLPLLPQAMTVDRSAGPARAARASS